MIFAIVINAWPMLLAIAGIAWWPVLRRQHRSLAVIALGPTMGCVPVQAVPLLLVPRLRSRRLMAEILMAVAASGATVEGEPALMRSPEHAAPAESGQLPGTASVGAMAKLPTTSKHLRATVRRRTAAFPGWRRPEFPRAPGFATSARPKRGSDIPRPLGRLRAQSALVLRDTGLG
ncbi:MAG: hypothetical protein WA751_08370 [Candidatus Dormiibacterota bacterium]